MLVCMCVSLDCYVADELVVSRAGRRVRVGNTDAEGRMVMVDLLCEMKEKVTSSLSILPNSYVHLDPFSAHLLPLTVIMSAGCSGDLTSPVHYCYSDWSCHQSHGTQLLCECCTNR